MSKKDNIQDVNHKFTTIKILSHLSPELALLANHQLERSIYKTIREFYDGNEDSMWSMYVQILTKQLMTKWNINHKADRTDAGRFFLGCWWPIFKDLVEVKDEKTKKLLEELKDEKHSDTFEALTAQERKLEKLAGASDEDEDDEDEDDCICDDCKKKCCKKASGKATLECKCDNPEDVAQLLEGLAALFGAIKEEDEDDAED